MDAFVWSVSGALRRGCTLGEDIDTIFDCEVRPHAGDCWIDRENATVGGLIA